MSLDRFVAAQEGVHEVALEELSAGRKRTHWIWFVLPQLDGLGRSPTALRYALADLDEARAYLAHPVLGPRLCEAVAALLAAPGSAEQVLGGLDALKVRSSMTLFARAAPDEPGPRAVLQRWYGGAEDPRTVELLARTAGAEESER